MSTTVEQMIDQYLKAWNEENLQAFKHEFGKCWAGDAIYIDPFGTYTGVDGIAGFAQLSLDIMPSRKFSVLEAPDHHHQFGRYTWSVKFDGGNNMGYDYFEFNEDFKITKLISFFKLPEDYPIDKLK